MRVAFVNRLAGIHRGGGEVYDLSLAAALRAAGTEIEVITGRPWLGRPPAPVEGLPVRYVCTPYLRGLSHRRVPLRWRVFDLDLRLFERAALAALASSRPAPDVVQVTGLPRLARRIETDLRLPAVLLFPGPPSEAHRDVIRACRHVVGVGAVTQYLKDRIREDVHDATAGVDVSLFKPQPSRMRERLGLPGDALVVLFAGRLVPLKNLPLLIESFADVMKAIPEATLLVAGDGPLRGDLASAARRSGMTVASPGGEADSTRPAQSDVVLLGAVPHEGMPGCYAASDLLVLSSLYESFSLVALEAMACGVPVLAPAAGYLPRLIENGVTGSLYPAGDRAAFAGRMTALLRDPETRRRLGASGREAAVKRHSWAAVAAWFNDLYGKALAG